MPSLISVIESIDGWADKTDQELYTALTTASIPFQDHELWTWAGVATVAGNAGAEGLRIALDQNQMAWAIHQLGGRGLDLSLPAVQQALYYFDSLGVPGMELLALSVKRDKTPLENAGLTATLSQVALARSKRLKSSVAVGRYNAYMSALASWNGDPQTEPTL
jgi:hypothetical protein